MVRHQRHREPWRPFFAEICGSSACAATRFGRTVDFNFRPVFFRREADMTGAIPALSHRLRPLLAALCLGTASLVVSAPALARGPDGIADVAEKVIDAVVNISTSQTVEAKGRGEGRRQLQALP